MTDKNTIKGQDISSKVSEPESKIQTGTSSFHQGAGLNPSHVQSPREKHSINLTYSTLNPAGQQALLVGGKEMTIDQSGGTGQTDGQVAVKAEDTDFERDEMHQIPLNENQRTASNDKYKSVLNGLSDFNQDQPNSKQNKRASK